MSKKHIYPKGVLTLLTIALGTLTISSCDKDTPGPDGNSPGGNKAPTELACDYFETEDRVLKDDPEAPVDYVVTCNMRVSKEITVEPGVVIEFKDNTGMVIEANGSLSAIGTADKPVIFRGTKRLPGFWYGVLFESSTSRKNEFKYIEVSDAGGREYANQTQGGVMVYADSRLKMSHSKLTNNEGYAFNARNADFDMTDIQNNLFADSKYPAYINTDNVHNFKNNTFQNNQESVVLTYGTQLTGGDITWPKADIPYRLESGYSIYKVLTIAPGVHIQMPQEGLLKIDEEGGLVCVGTENDRILFTSTAKVPKAWIGIFVDGGNPTNEIAYTDFEYSGFPDRGDNKRTNIHLWFNARLNIHNTKFRHLTNCAINYALHTDQTANPNLSMDLGSIEADGCTATEWD